MNGQELIELSTKLQQDLRAAQAKLVQLRAGVAALNLSDGEPKERCPECGILLARKFPLDDHLANVHGVEETEHRG
jgi:uncharacterized C2H2 Zn-finger protein